MRGRLQDLVKRLSAAVDRRRQMDPARLQMLDDTLAVLAQDYADSQHYAGSPHDAHYPHDADPQHRTDRPHRTDPQHRTDPVDPDGFEHDVLADTGKIFGLDEADRDLLLIGAAADLDANIALAYGLLRGGTGACRVSIALALELIGLSSLSPEVGARLGAAGALRRSGLVDTAADGPWLSRELWCPERVVDHIRGWNAPDSVVGPHVMAAHVVDSLAVEVPGSAQVAAALEAGTELVWVHSPLGAAGVSVAAVALKTLAVRALAVTAPTNVTGSKAAEFVRSAIREAALQGGCLILHRAERLVVGDAAALVESLASPVVPVLAVSQESWDPGWTADLRPLLVDAPRLDPRSRAQLWRAATGNDVPADALSGLRLSPEAVLATAQCARDLAGPDGSNPDAETIRRAARLVGGVTAAVDDVRLRDLVLPQDVNTTVERLVGWARHREDLVALGLVAQAGGRGGGITALFSGSPGTGKTLAAHAVAAELGMDIIRVDLSAIVDKYIGETQKNLEQIFHRAESLNVVLFFDEADALFGRRSEVKDAHDRYANQDVAYLLQRMELFDGITILATNLRGNLDPAFSRRLSFIVHFPDPDAATRTRLWKVHLDRLGEHDPDDPIDAARLALGVELTGGDIRNIVVAAGYDAAINAERPGMRHVIAAATREYTKLGRRVPSGGLLPVAP